LISPRLPYVIYDLLLACQEKEGPEAEAVAVRLAKQLKDSGLLRAYGGADQASGCCFEH